MDWKQSVLSEEYKTFLENGYSKFEAASLCKAKVKTLEEAEEHLFGDELVSPRLIRNIEQAVELIWCAVCSGVRICVFGDYDADGITASAIMFLALKKLGANVVVRLPDRIEEGYAISLKAVKEQIELGTELFVTVDNGVRAIDEAEYIKEQGKKLVVLDHHEPGEQLPAADAVIDLHIPGETYPYVELTGSGLAWKVPYRRSLIPRSYKDLGSCVEISQNLLAFQPGLYCTRWNSRRFPRAGCVDEVLHRW